jgi:hypothetical protein
LSPTHGKLLKTAKKFGFVGQPNWNLGYRTYKTAQKFHNWGKNLQFSFLPSFFANLENSFYVVPSVRKMFALHRKKEKRKEIKGFTYLPSKIPMYGKSEKKTNKISEKR